MRHIEKTGRDALTKLALRSGKSREEICSEIQKAIDAAWASQDLTAQVLQKELFPRGKPSPEEFVSVLARKIR